MDLQNKELLERLEISLQNLEKMINAAETSLAGLNESTDPKIVAIKKQVQERILTYRRGVARQRELATTIKNPESEKDQQTMEVIVGISTFIKEDALALLAETKKV